MNGRQTLGIGLQQDGFDVVENRVCVEERGTVDISDPLALVDKKYPEDMRHGAHVVAVFIIVTNDPLPVGIQRRLQHGVTGGCEEKPVGV